MEDFPRDLLEFEARFSTEKACREYLCRLRWPDGFCCPRCGGRKSWPKSEVLLECAGCGYQASVTAGTIFQDTRQPYIPGYPFEIVLDRQADLIGQRKFQWLAGFGLANVNLPFSPMK